jgi:WD40 repeat protein
VQLSVAQQPEVVLPIGHTETITGVAISPDGKYLVTASEDNTGKIWNYRTGRFMYDLVLHTGDIVALQMSRDGSFVVLASADGSYSKWQTATGKLLFHSSRMAGIRDAVLLKGDTSILLMKDYVMVIAGFTPGSRDMVFDEIYESTPGDIKKHMAISPDGNKLAIHQNNQELKIFDLNEGKQQQWFEKINIDSTRFYKLEDMEPEQLFFSSNDQVNGTWGGYFMAGFDLTNNRQAFFYPRSVYYPAFNEDNSLVSFKNGRDDSIRVWDTRINAIRFIIPNEKKLSVVQFTQDGSALILHRDKIVQEWSVTGQLITERMLDEPVSSPYNINKAGSLAHNSIPYGVQTINWQTGKLLHEFIGKIPSVKEALVSVDGNWLFELKKEYAGYWQLQRMKAERFPEMNDEVVKKIYLANQPHQVLLQYSSSLALFDCIAGKTIYTMDISYECHITVKKNFFYTTDRGMVQKWDMQSGKILLGWPIAENMRYPVFSPDDSLFAFQKRFSDDDSIFIWSLAENKLAAAFSRPRETIESGFVTIYTPGYEPSMRFSPDNKKLYFSAGEKGFISIARLPYKEIYADTDYSDTVDIETEMLYEEGTLEYFTAGLPIAFHSKDSLVFISKDMEAGDDEIVALDYNQARRYSLSYPDFQRIIYHDEALKQLHTATTKEWLVWDLVKKIIIKKIALPTAMRAIMYLPAGDQLLLQSHDRIALLPREDKKPRFFFSSLDKNETVAYRSDRFYKAGPSIAKWFSWKVADKFYDFDQWDLRYNRPDKLMELTAAPDRALQSAYYNAYTKRLQRNNIAEKDFGKDLAMPETILLNKEKDGDLVTADSIWLKIQLRPVSKKSPIKNILVSVNDNPVWGRAGYPVAKSAKKDQQLELPLKLSAGSNRIKVSCTDVNGRESLREQFTILHEPKALPPVKTWFIGIGINRFADSTHNLQWSVKDIRDLAIKFKEKTPGAISIDTLFDNSVSIENIRRLKAKLMQTAVDDRVIISYSGHGLLSRSFDYYLSTYDVNFKDPETSGLPYGELENLLDGIAARKKLLLIDACHSGEVDKEEMQQMQQVGSSIASQGVKGVKPLSAQPVNRVGIANSFQLMQELFINMGNSTGATIIAAAAGTQFALERNSLKNGVFSYAILEMMQQQPAITISGLNEYVNKRVTELTNGLQVPSARKENMADNWTLW